MKFHLAPLFLLTILAAPAEEPSFHPAGLRLVWDDRKEAFENFSLFGAQKPLTLAVLLEAPGKGIISLDLENSELGRLEDDAGTDLDGEFWPFPKISEDQQMVRFEIHGGKAPATGAREIHAAGEVKLITAGERQTTKSEPLQLKEDTEVAIDDKLDFTVGKVGKPNWGDAALSVELKFDRDIPEIAEVRFLDADGKAIETKPGGSSRSAFFNKVSVTRSFNLDRKVDLVFLEIDRWTDIEEKILPFELKVGLGGGD